MMPRILDLYSCQGGAAKGYFDAGFDVYGVDYIPQPRYPFPFAHGEAIGTLRKMLDGGTVGFTNGERLGLDDFDAIHASPPCQLYTQGNAGRATDHPDLVAPTRNVLIESGLPWVMENVPRAPLIDPITLCWTMFHESGSVIDDDGTPLQMFRHRLFESNIDIAPPAECSHDKSMQVAGAYGGARRDKWEARHIRRGGYVPPAPILERLLEIDWMDEAGMFQSIPPAYSEHIGAALLARVTVEV